MRLLIIFAVLIPAAFVFAWMVKSKWQSRHLDNAQRRKALRTEIDLVDEESQLLDLQSELTARRRKLDERQERELNPPA